MEFKASTTMYIKYQPNFVAAYLKYYLFKILSL